MSQLGKKLTEEKYKELVEGSILSSLTLKEIVDIAINLDSFWEFAGTYYKLNSDNPTIIIDREQSVGGYNNSELTLLAVGNFAYSNDKQFQTQINETIASKAKMTNTPKPEEDSLIK